MILLLKCKQLFPSGILGTYFKCLRTWVSVRPWDNSFSGIAFLNEIYTINGVMYVVLHVYEGQQQHDEIGTLYLDSSKATYIERIAAVSDLLVFTPMWDHPIDSHGWKKFVPMGPALLDEREQRDTED